MALWLLGLKAFLVFISLSHGVTASSQPLRVGSILLLPTNAETPIEPLTDDVEQPIEYLPENVEIQSELPTVTDDTTTLKSVPETSSDDIVSRDVEEVTDTFAVLDTTPAEVEAINPDLGSSHDLLTSSKNSDPRKEPSPVGVSEIDHEVEILDVQDSKTAGKTHLAVNNFESEAEEIAEFGDGGEGEEAGLHPVRKQQSLLVHREKVFEGEICTEEVNQAEGDIEMAGAPTDSTCTGFAWTVNVGDGFSADVTLKALNVSEVNGEFMIIGPGSSLENLWQDESNPIFTAVIKKERKFRILESTDFTVFLVTNSPDGFQGGFSLSYERAVQLQTTPSPTTPAPTLPTPGANVTSVVTVYLGGKTPKQFHNSLEQFKEAVANMSIKYAEVNTIELSEKPTSDNVLVTLVTQCDYSWPESETCVRTNISVALITPNSANPDKFELTAEHLQDMWDTIAATDEGLKTLGLYVYKLPNASGMMLTWLGISLGVLVVFLVFLLVVWRVEVIRDYARMTSKQEISSGRDSTMSRPSEWFPTGSQHQLVPPFMDVYSEVGYVEYEPEFNGPAPLSKYQAVTTVKPIPTYEPPPKYGPPTGFGGAIPFYGSSIKHFENDAFEEDEEPKEEEINTSQIKYQLPGILKNTHDTDNSTC